MDTLKAILSDATTIAALIAAFAAIVSPIRTAHIEAKTQIKLKELELYQAEKIKSYKQLTEALGACRRNPTSSDADRLYEALSLASIYSSVSTSKKLAMLAGSHLGVDSMDFPTLYTEAMAAMRDELAETQDKSANRKNRYKKP